MSERQFLEASAKQRAADTVRAVEAQTAAEVVVAVRRRASYHVWTSVAFGAVCALAGFAYMWFSEQVYDVMTMPLDAAVAWVLGGLLCALVAPLRRLLTPSSVRRRRAERAAHAAFSALGIDKTRARTGLLVYVALFERTCVLVPDSGVPAAAMAGALGSVRDALDEAVRRVDFEAFLAAVSRLGPACGGLLPRGADDVNELRDSVA
jgi:putative membrane protein